MRRSLLLGLGLLSVAGPVQAQRIPSPYRFIEPSQDLAIVGAWTATDRGRIDLGPKSGLGGGLQYTIRISDPLALSARILYFPTRRELIDTATVADTLRTVSEGEVDLDLLLVSARFQFTITGARTWHGIAPYIVAGVGIVVETSGDPDPPTAAPASRYDFGQALLGQLGVGASVFFTERWALRFSVLDNLWKIKAPEALQDTRLDPVPPESEWTNNWEFMAGIARYF